MVMFRELMTKPRYVIDWVGDSVDFVQFMRKPRDCNRLNVI